MRNRKCRITVQDMADHSVGCGFIADPRHVMTCAHVVKSAQKTPPFVGDCIKIKTDGGELLEVKVVNSGAPMLDLCVLERTDAGSFPLTDTALWASGAPGQEYSGLGMHKDYGEISLAGKLGAYGMGSVFQIISADGEDNRVENGSSGAPIFATGQDKVTSDGPLLGMVTDFQQTKAGKIIPAETLAQFWPTLRRFDAKSDEALPTMVKGGVDNAIVSRLVREIDRVPQRRPFKEKVDQPQYLASHNYLIAMFSGVWADLPDRCAHVLGSYAFTRLMRQLAPDTVKTNVIPATLDELLSETANGAARNLLDKLAWRYSTETDYAAILHCMSQETTPITILATATPQDLPYLTAKMVTGWAKCLDTLVKLAEPEKRKPILMFIMVVGDDQAGNVGAAAPVLALKKAWYVCLPELGRIETADVLTWALQLPDDLPGRTARAQIEGILGTRAPAGTSFRLKELESWLGGG